MGAQKANIGEGESAHPVAKVRTCALAACTVLLARAHGSLLHLAIRTTAILVRMKKVSMYAHVGGRRWRWRCVRRTTARTARRLRSLEEFTSEPRKFFGELPVDAELLRILLARLTSAVRPVGLVCATWNFEWQRKLSERRVRHFNEALRRLNGVSVGGHPHPTPHPTGLCLLQAHQRHRPTCYLTTFLITSERKH